MQRLSKHFCHQQSWWQRSIIDRQFLCRKMDELIATPDAFFSEHILKSDASNTTTVVKITINDRAYVIKRYNIKGIWHGIKRAIQPSRAIHCLYSALKLRSLGIATVRPVGIIEKRFGCFRRRAYFIYEYLEGIDGFEAFDLTQLHSPLTVVRAKNTIALIKQLHQYHIVHRDLKASNFIFQKDKAYFIDLDAVTFYRSHQRAARRKNKDIQRFLLNWHTEQQRQLFHV